MYLLGNLCVKYIYIYTKIVKTGDICVMVFMILYWPLTWTQLTDLCLTLTSRLRSKVSGYGGTGSAVVCDITKANENSSGLKSGKIRKCIHWKGNVIHFGGFDRWMRMIVTLEYIDCEKYLYCDWYNHLSKDRAGLEREYQSTRSPHCVHLGSLTKMQTYFILKDIQKYLKITSLMEQKY